MLECGTTTFPRGLPFHKREKKKPGMKENEDSWDRSNLKRDYAEDLVRPRPFLLERLYNLCNSLGIKRWILELKPDYPLNLVI